MEARIWPRWSTKTPVSCRQLGPAAPTPWRVRSAVRSHGHQTRGCTRAATDASFRPNCRYSVLSGLLMRTMSGTPYCANHRSASSGGDMCTNATCVPVASIADRVRATSAKASRQNVHPKCRRKIRSSGAWSDMLRAGSGSVMRWSRLTAPTLRACGRPRRSGESLRSTSRPPSRPRCASSGTSSHPAEAAVRRSPARIQPSDAA